MFYEPHQRPAALAHDPLKAIVAPRPIGWISTISQDGLVNLAPYSFFNMIGDRPPLVMLSSSGRKDTVTNIAANMEFVCNLVTFDLREAMNQTSAPVPAGVNEFDLAGLEAAPSRLVRPPRVAAARAALECRAVSMFRVRDLNGHETENHVVIGQVVGIHIDEDAIRDGRFDMAALRPIMRGGYHDYVVATPETTFAMARPEAN